MTVLLNYNAVVNGEDAYLATLRNLVGWVPCAAARLGHMSWPGGYAVEDLALSVEG